MSTTAASILATLALLAAVAGCMSSSQQTQRARVTLYQPAQRACAEACVSADDPFGCLRECPRATVAAGTCDRREPPAEVACAAHTEHLFHRGWAVTQLQLGVASTLGDGA